MNVTVNGITAKIEWESFAKARDPDGPRVTIVYQMAYADGDAFADGVLGGIVVTGGAVKNLPRHACPTNPRLYALRAGIAYAAERDDGPPATGAGPDAVGSPAFDTARVMVEYGVVPFSQFATDDPGGAQSFANDLVPGAPFLYADCEIDFGSQTLNVPKELLTDATSFTKSPANDVPVEQPLMTWRVTRHNYPRLPYAMVGTLVKCLNNAVFLGQPVGRVMFDSARSFPGAAADGTKVQTFEMIFAVKTYDWNAFPLEGNGGADRIVYKTNHSQFIYNYADLSVLVYS